MSNIKLPEYIIFLNSHIERRLWPSDSEYYCNRCYQTGYITEDEMQFLMHSNNIIHNKIYTHIPKFKPCINDQNIKDVIPFIPVNFYTKVDYIYVSRFCPKCDIDKFGELSKWRK